MADKNLIGVGAASSVFVGMTDIGYTLGGIELSINQNTFDLEADQSNSALAITLLEKEYFIKVPFAESSIDNIATFFTADKTTAVTGTTALILDANDFPGTTTLGFRTDLFGALKTLHFFFHAVQVDSVEALTVNKGSQMVWAVNFRAFPITGGTTPGYIYLKTA